MTDRRLSAPGTEANTEGKNGHRHFRGGHVRLGDHRAAHPLSREDVEQRYLAARDEWIRAMKASQSGKTADLAALAMAQDKFETALAVKRRWDAAPRVAIPVEPDRPRGIDAIVAQEFARRRIQEHQHELEEASPGGLRGFFRRLRRR